MIPGVTPLTLPMPIARATFLQSIIATSTQATVSFGNVTAPKAGLLVVAYVGGSSVANRTITDISIGGTTATKHINSAASTDPHCLASRLVSSGANAISITFNTTTTSAQHGLGCWLIENAASTVPTGTDAQTLAAATVISTTFPVSMGGFAVWGVRNLTTTGNTFSSATIRSNSTTGTIRFTFADRLFFTAPSSHVESVSNTTSASRIGVGGSWR